MVVQKGRIDTFGTSVARGDAVLELCPARASRDANDDTDDDDADDALTPCTWNPHEDEWTSKDMEHFLQWYDEDAEHAAPRLVRVVERHWCLPTHLPFLTCEFEIESGERRFAKCRLVLLQFVEAYRAALVDVC